MNFLIFDNRLYPVNEPLFTASNRGFKYGDGLFETMRLQNGIIHLAAFHWDRLDRGLKLLGIHPCFSFQEFNSLAHKLYKENDCRGIVKLRLTLFRKEDDKAGYILETSLISEERTQYNPSGWKVGIYSLAKKPIDQFSNIKSANYLPYVLAAKFAEQNQWHDALLLNTEGAICDASIANLFIVKDQQLITPSLKEGCIEGVMRRYIIEQAKQHHITVHEQRVTEKDLHEADEAFLTNAIIGMKWIEFFHEKKFTNRFSHKFFHNILQPL